MSGGYYPAGAENDPSAPWNERELTVEVNAEVGTFVQIPIDGSEIDSDTLKELVEEAVKEKLNIDNNEIMLNNFEVCDYR